MQNKNCPLCGKKFIPRNSKQKFCNNPCNSKMLSKKTYSYKLIQRKAERLNELIRQADELKISYGKYRVLLNSGKTFEELKQNANN